MKEQEKEQQKPELEDTHTEIKKSTKPGFTDKVVTKVGITETPVMALPPVKPEGGTGGVTGEMSPIMSELNGQAVEQERASIDIFEEVPLEVCGQMYSTALDLTYALKYKTASPNPIPQQRIDTQGAILYGILKKNQMSVKHIDLFMLGMGMMGDWKMMCSSTGELKEGTEEYIAAYGELKDGDK